MTVIELLNRLTELQKQGYGDTEVCFSTQHSKSPVFEAEHTNGAQFVTLRGEIVSTGYTLSISTSDNATVAEKVG